MSSSTLAARAAPRDTTAAVDGVISLDFDDVLDFAEHVRPWNLEYTQVRRGPFRSTGFIARFGATTLGSARMNQGMVHRVAVPEGQCSAFAISADSDAWFLGTRTLRAGDCLSVRGGVSFETVTRGYVCGYALSFDESAWRATDEWYAPLPDASGGLSIEAFGPEWVSHLQALSEAMLGMVASRAPMFDASALRASFGEQLLTHVRNGRRPEQFECTTHRARARRRAAVQRAREFINSRLSEPIRLEQVCRYACAQSRTLEYGFREMFDTPMVGYIKALRMNRVHQLLRNPAQSHRTVSELALDTGFWHLSQFASDYKKFFGESPSQTHRRARGATGPRALTS
jgi:AraC family ethanolamine operon transcriptional activator